MSVVKSKQNESKRSFVTISENLFKECLRVCIKMPRRYTNLVLSPIIEFAGQITDNVHKANEIFLSEHTRSSDAERRLNYINMALENLGALSFRINVFLYMPEGITYYDPKDKSNTKIIFGNMEQIALLIDEERRTLKGLLRHDKDFINRYRLIK